MSAITSDRSGELQRIAHRLAGLPEDRQLTFLKQLRDHGIAFTQLPIVAAQRPQRVPLSFAQRQQWFLWKLRPQSAAYHLALTLRLRGEVDATVLERAVNALIQRHESLRTRFHLEEDEAVQLIVASARIAIRQMEVAPADAAASIEEALSAPFDLENGSPLRVTLLRCAPREHLLVVALHHIVGDAWSLNLMMQELAVLYSAERAGKSALLPELPIQYADFSLWQHRLMAAGEFDRQLDYWREQLGQISLAQELLPLDRPRPEAATERGAHYRLDLGPVLSEKLKAFAHERGTTLFAVLLASLNVLFHRYSGQRDIRVGTPVANRQRPETEHLIGYLMNTLVLRTQLTPEADFDEIVGRVKAAVQGALAHQDLPFEQLVEALNPQRRRTSNPLFNVLYTHEAHRRREVRLSGLDAERLVLPQRSVQVDLSIATGEHDGTIGASILYAADLYDASTIERIAGHWRNLLERMLDHPHLRIGNIDMLSTAERERVLFGWNDTERIHAGPRTLHALVEEQAARTPDAISVVNGQDSLSYCELMIRANAIAARLQELGVQAEDRVAICMERCLDLVPSLLGVLQVGAAYVPLDPEYPVARLALMLSDARPRAVLTQRSLLPFVQRLGTNVPACCVDEIVAPVGKVHVPSVTVHPASLAYCIYTSGSTGTPKAVAISHRGIVNFLNGVQERLRLVPADRVLALASLSFDMSCLDIFLPLSIGARVVLAERSVAVDPHVILDCIRYHGITALQATPTTWRMLSTHDSQGILSGCKALTGGESLPPDLASDLVASTRGVCNLYGPTETSVYSSTREITSQCPEPWIGTPLDNNAIYVLSEDLQAAPPGVIGDLYIGGSGVARGYLHRPSLTADRFVPSPFVHGERLYRTGDLGRYRVDGVLECLGREDQQIKIRGYRIEPGEIEAALRSHADVHEAAAAVHVGRDGDQYLVAYIVPVTKQLAEDARGRLSHELAGHLKTRLPAYMVPAHYQCLPSLPRTPSGKLDRRALVEPVRSNHASNVYVGPRSSLESELVALWEDALDVRPIGVHDNFFELGGHSLLAVQLTDAISRGLGRRIPLAQLFQSQSVAELAEALSTTHKSKDVRSLVILEATGNAHPVCCLHPGGGQVLGYRSLARSLRGCRPVYGLQSRLFYRDDWVDDCIESMAVHYAEEIARQTAGRPVHLLGWSAGCFIANETVRLLAQTGQPVLSLGMIDPVALLNDSVSEPRPQLHDEQAAERQLRRWMERAHCRLQWEKLLELCDQATRLELLSWFVTADLEHRSLSVVEEYVHLTEAHYFMVMQKYRFRSIAGVTQVWWASQTLAAREPREAPLPASLTADVRIIEADHLSIVNHADLHQQMGSLLEERDALFAKHGAALATVTPAASTAGHRLAVAFQSISEAAATT